MIDRRELTAGVLGAAWGAWLVGEGMASWEAVSSWLALCLITGIVVGAVADALRSDSK